MTGADSLTDLLVGDVSEWLEALPQYQQTTIASLLATREPVEVATLWLENTGHRDTAPFGGIRNAANSFYDNILRELQKALCSGAPEYEVERKELVEATKGGGKLLLVGAISTMIAPHVGAAAAVIGPAVALTLGIISSAGKATVCEALEDLIARRAEVAQAQDSPDGALQRDDAEGS